MDPNEDESRERPKAYLYITFEDDYTVTTTASDLAAGIEACRLAKSNLITKVVVRFTDGTYVTVTSGSN